MHSYFKVFRIKGHFFSCFNEFCKKTKTSAFCNVRLQCLQCVVSKGKFLLLAFICIYRYYVRLLGVFKFIFASRRYYRIYLWIYFFHSLWTLIISVEFLLPIMGKLCIILYQCWGSKSNWRIVFFLILISFFCTVNLEQNTVVLVSNKVLFNSQLLILFSDNSAYKC